MTVLEALFILFPIMVLCNIVFIIIFDAYNSRNGVIIAFIISIIFNLSLTACVLNYA